MQKFSSVRYVFLSGEALSAELVKRFYWNTSLTMDLTSGQLVGKATVRDVEKYAKEIDLPRMIDGTTYITVDLAAEILGFKVHCYDGGLIVLSENDQVLTAGEVETIINEYAR